ncbi:DUF3291 domain-containing protein [Yinghuangia soli]|uniref:DUF3291 domain-containing protein n=1 Tax=Yinghuangia soli TaxID=2908204 RepID=A0AA41Q600_9ACTN|nr:DUF3291 domain-containing protein [Yinghuangia soli]MCF2532204.1 DUF3291 domain-containing protein [Yinghuangia soli]
MAAMPNTPAPARTASTDSVSPAVSPAAGSSSAYQLAQLNVAQLRAPIDSPQLADFVAGLHKINQLAEASPGFVWRLIGDEANPDATYEPAVFAADVLVNLSVWADIDTLWDFAYRGPHLDYLRRRGEWFGDIGERSQVMWWVPAGHRPTEQEGAERLELLRRNGPSPEAFTFRQRHPAPDAG